MFDYQHCGPRCVVVEVPHNEPHPGFGMWARARVAHVVHRIAEVRTDTGTVPSFDEHHVRTSSDLGSLAARLILDPYYNLILTPI
jgi:hypothetical protein